MDADTGKTTALEHYEKAGRLLFEVEHPALGTDPRVLRNKLLAAQGHAMCAVAGVTALAGHGGLPQLDVTGWMQAAGSYGPPSRHLAAVGKADRCESCRHLMADHRGDTEPPGCGLCDCEETA